MRDEEKSGHANSETPSLTEMLATVRPAADASSALQEAYEARFSGISIDAQRSYAHLLGLHAHYVHKRIWSFFLMGVMAFMILFQSYLLCKVGSNEWDFSKYSWLLPALLVQNLAQIIGLAIIVVRSLFTNIDSEPRPKPKRK